MIRVLFHITLICLPILVTAQSTFQVVIEKNDSLSPSFISHSITEVHTGDIYAVGTIYPNGGYSEIRLIKLNSTGVVLWDTTYKDTQTPAAYEYTYEYSPDVIPAYDGGVILACRSFSYANDGSEENGILVWKINEKGVIEWQRLLDSFSFADMCLTGDNGYLFTGQNWEDVSNQMDVIVYKTDLHGNVLWQTQLGNEWVSDDVISVKEMDGQIYVAGHQSINGWSDLYGALHTLDSLGNFLWELYLPVGSTNTRINSVLKFDGNYYFNVRPGLFEFDCKNGNYWEVPDSLVLVHTGKGYNYHVSCGISQIGLLNKHSGGYYFLQKYDNLIEPFYEQDIPQITGTMVESIFTMDGGMLVSTGNAQSMQITKTDCLGNVDHWSEECNSKIPEDQQLIIYPNPADNEIRIDAGFDFNEVAIYSPNGQFISVENPCNCPRQTINISDLAAGVYVVRISSDKNYAISRFVKY